MPYARLHNSQESELVPRCPSQHCVPVSRQGDSQILRRLRLASICLSVIIIQMFHLARNIIRNCREKHEKRITLILLGLDNAGKTTLLHHIKGGSLCFFPSWSIFVALCEVPATDTLPSCGFTPSQTVTWDRYSLVIYDLGGGRNFRGIWKSYFGEVHGVLYVVDSADPRRLEESAREFTEVLQHKFLKDKPLLMSAGARCTTSCPVPRGDKHTRSSELEHRRPLLCN